MRVLAGQHSGDTGMVVTIDAETQMCYILSDTTREEIKAFTR